MDGRGSVKLWLGVCGQRQAAGSEGVGLLVIGATGWSQGDTKIWVCF